MSVDVDQTLHSRMGWVLGVVVIRVDIDSLVGVFDGSELVADAISKTEEDGTSSMGVDDAVDSIVDGSIILKDVTCQEVPRNASSSRSSIVMKLPSHRVPKEHWRIQ